MEQQTFEEFEFQKEVRQGCVPSSLLFNIYSESHSKEALENENEGIRVNGVIIDNLGYVDDIMILADNAADL